MPAVGRYVNMKARAGQGEALAEVLLHVADGLRSTAGCELYAISSISWHRMTPAHISL